MVGNGGEFTGGTESIGHGSNAPRSHKPLESLQSTQRPGLVEMQLIDRMELRVRHSVPPVGARSSGLQLDAEFDAQVGDSYHGWRSRAAELPIATVVRVRSPLCRR